MIQIRQTYGGLTGNDQGQQSPKADSLFNLTNQGVYKYAVPLPPSTSGGGGIGIDPGGFGGPTEDPGDGGGGIEETGDGEGGGVVSPPPYSCNHQLAVQNLTTTFKGKKVFTGSATDMIIINVLGNAVFDSVNVILRGGILANNIIWNIRGSLSILNGNDLKGVFIGQSVLVLNRWELAPDITMGTPGKITIVNDYKAQGGEITICGLNEASPSGIVANNKPVTNQQNKIYYNTDCGNYVNKSPDIPAHTPVKVIRVMIHVFKPVTTANVPAVFSNYDEADKPYLTSLIEGLNAKGGVRVDNQGAAYGTPLTVPKATLPDARYSTYINSTVNTNAEISYPNQFLTLNDNFKNLATATPTYGVLGTQNRPDSRVQFVLVPNGIKFYYGAVETSSGRKIENVLEFLTSAYSATAYQNALGGNLTAARAWLNANNESDPNAINIVMTESYTPDDILKLTSVSSSSPSSCSAGFNFGGLSTERYEGTNIARGLGDNWCLIQGRNFLGKYHYLEGLYKLKITGNTCTYRSTVARPDWHQLNVTSYIVAHEVLHCIGLGHTNANGLDICSNAPYDGPSGASFNNAMTTRLPSGQYSNLTHCQKGRVHELLESSPISKVLINNYCTSSITDPTLSTTYVSGNGTANVNKWYSRMMLTGNLDVSGGAQLKVGCKLTFPSTVNGRNPQLAVKLSSRVEFMAGATIGKGSIQASNCSNATNLEIGSTNISSTGQITFNPVQGFVFISGHVRVEPGISIVVKKGATLYIGPQGILEFLGAGNFVVEDGGYLCVVSNILGKGAINMGTGSITFEPNANIGMVNPDITDPIYSTCSVVTACNIQSFDRYEFEVKYSTNPAVRYTNNNFVNVCANTPVEIKLVNRFGNAFTGAFVWRKNGVIIPLTSPNTSENIYVVSPTGTTDDVYTAVYSAGGCSYSYSIRLTSVQPSFTVESVNACVGERFRIKLNTTGYPNLNGITWSTPGANAVTPIGVNTCTANCQEYVVELVYFTAGVHEVTINIVNAVPGCTMQPIKIGLQAFAKEANGQCCYTGYSRVLGVANQVTDLNLGGQDVIYGGNTKVVGAINLRNGKLIFPPGSVVEMGYNDEVGYDDLTTTAGLVKPTFHVRGDVGVVTEVVAEGTIFREYCGLFPSISPFSLYGNAKVTIGTNAANPSLKSVVQTEGRPFHSQMHTGFLNLTEVQFPKVMLGMKLKGGGTSVANTGVSISNCYFLGGGNLELATEGTLTVNNNNFGPTTLSLNHNTNTNITENKWLDAIGSLIFKGINNNTVIRCNSFRVNLPISTNHTAIAIYENAQVNLVGGFHNIGSATINGDKAGNFFAIDATDQAIQTSTLFQAGNFTSPQITINGLQYRFAALLNDSPNQLNYHNFSDEFVGTTVGPCNPSGNYPSNMLNTTAMNNVTCLNPSVLFPPLLRQGQLTDLVGDDRPSIDIHPNPSTGLFTLSGADKVTTIDIFNSASQLVFHADGLGIDQYDLDLKGKPVGIYYLRLQVGKKVISSKLLKQ